MHEEKLRTCIKLQIIEQNLKDKTLVRSLVVLCSAAL